MCNRLIGIDDFESLIEMAVKAGDTSGVDLLFKDYYALEQHQKQSKEKDDFVCISLANIAQMTPEQVKSVNKEKLARSLLQLIAFNIAEVAFLYAKLYKVDKALFTGNFILNKKVTQIFIMEAFNYFVETMNYNCRVVYSLLVSF